MTVQLSALRVSAALDASGYTGPAASVQRANREMAASGKLAAMGLRDVAAETVNASGKISRTGNVAAQMARQFVDGYRQVELFESGLRRLNGALESGKLDAQQAGVIYAGMSAKLGQTATATDIAERGFTTLSAAVAANSARFVASEAAIRGENAALISNAAAANTAAAANKNLALANDNNARFRKQNLGYQAFDIGQTLALGMNPGMIAAQQLPQIAQLYVAQGGLNALWKDASGLLLGLARAAGPWIAAGALIYGGYKLISANSAEAKLAVDDATAALAAQAAPIESLSGRVSELQRITDEYAKAIRGTAKDQSLATASIVANSEREFNAKKSLLELELKRQRAAIETQKAAIAIAGLGVRNAVQPEISDPGLVQQGFRDPRVGRLTQIPEINPWTGGAVSGVANARRIIEGSGVTDKIKQMRAELTLAEIAVAGVDAALKTTFDQGVEVSIGRIAKATGGTSDAYRDLIKNAKDRIDQMQLEEQLIGKSGVAADALRFRLELLQDATDKGRAVNANKLAVIDALTEAYRAQAARLAELTALDELMFERQQIGRSAVDQRVYAELRQIGLDINSIEGQRVADAIRINERMLTQRELFAEVADIAAGMFARPLKNGETMFDRLIDRAGDLGAALQKAIGGKAGAGIGGALGGIGAGYQAQDPLMGALGGALSGAAGGMAAGPLGALIGGAAGLLGGLIGGFLGKAKKAREEAEAMARSLDDLSLRTLRAKNSLQTVEGTLQIFDRAAKIEVERAKAAGASAEVIAATEEALAAERLAIIEEAARREKALNEDLTVRLARATTNASTLEGALRIFDLEGGIEHRRALEANTSAANMLLLEQSLSAERMLIIEDFNNRAIEEQQRIADEQRKAAEEAAEAALRAMQALRDFGREIDAFRRSLALDSTLSVLSPAERLAAARGDFDRVSGLVLSGDESARGDLQGATQAALREARSFYANDANYARIFAEIDARLRQVQSYAGYASGGYTGDGALNEMAGFVHRREFVANAAATARWRPQLEAMNAGRSPGNDNWREAANVFRGGFGAMVSEMRAMRVSIADLQKATGRVANETRRAADRKPHITAKAG